MRHSVAVPVALALSLASAAALAQEEDEQESKFYEIEALIVDGEIQVPDGQRYDATEEIEFDRLHEIEKRSFLDRSRESEPEE